MTTSCEVALLRLAAQRLAGPPAGSAAEAVRWMTALQAQDLPGALTSVALRTGDGSRAGVEAALDAGDVVRSWPMRGTLHLVLGRDLGWMLDLTTERLVAAAASRRAALGVDEVLLGRAEEVAVAELEGGRRCSREALVEAWDRAGLLQGVSGRSYHLMWMLAQTGTTCLGPPGPPGAGGQQVVLLAEWVPAPRRLERDEALGELALRYFRSHGPATTKDLARWTGLRAADVRTGTALARPALEALVLDGAEYLLDPLTAERLAAAAAAAAAAGAGAGARGARRTMLLPGFDELVLGYADRSPTVAPEHAHRVVPGSNGMFAPTVVTDGRAVGTWRWQGSGARRRVLATPFEAFPDGVEDAVPALAAALP